MRLNSFYEIKVDILNEFKCVKGECLNSCCADLCILADEPCIQKMRQLNAAIAVKFLKNIESVGSVWRLKTGISGKCKFLNKKERICIIHQELGEQYLPMPCYEFPRITNGNELLSVYTLSLSCPEAARLLLNTKKSAHFVKIKKREIEEKINNELALSFLELQIQEKTVEILENQDCKIKLRLHQIAVMYHEIEAYELNEQNIFQITEILKKYPQKGFCVNPNPHLNDNDLKERNLKNYFLQYLSNDLEGKKPDFLPFQNSYSSAVRKFVSDIYKCKKLNLRNVQHILDQYELVLQRYLITLVYNTIFPYEHENLIYAYQYLILKLYTALILTSHLFRKKNAISEADLIFSLSYISKIYEHIDGRAVVFYEFNDFYQASIMELLSLIPD